MRYIALFFAAVFLWFACLQLNDPDPVLWVVLYLIPVYVSLMTFFRKTNRELLIVLSVFYTSYAINSWLQMTQWEGFFTEGSGMEMKSANQELAREAIGLMICVAAYLVLIVLPFRIKDKSVNN